MPDMDANNLRNIGHDSTVPFTVKLDNDNQLLCEKILRIIPGKRIVCKAKLENQDVIAKFFLDPVHANRHLKREAAGLNALSQAQILTPAVIGQFTTSTSIKILITQYLANAQSPSDLLKTKVIDDQGKKVLAQFFALIAKFHNKGLAQNDLHFDNFLLKDNKLYAIDAADLKITKAPLTTEAATKNLAIFFAQFNQDLYPELLQTLKNYQNPNFTIDQNTLLPKAIAKRQLIWKKLSKKLFKNCTDIVRVKTFSKLILCKRNYYKNDFANFLNNPDPIIAKSHLLKKGNSSTVALVEINNQKFVVKRFNIKNLTKLIVRQLLPTRAHSNWLFSHLLLFNDIATPAPIAMIENRFGPLRGIGYIITEYIDSPNIQQALAQTKNLQIQKQIIDDFSKILLKLAQNHISHGDLKNTNFMVTNSAIMVADLDAMKSHRTAKTFKKAHQKDCQRYLNNFENTPNLHQIASKSLKF